MRLNNGERMTDLCREIGISRKTGYKIYKRYKELGPTGLMDAPRAPNVVPHATPQEMVELVLELKAKYPTWGAHKIRDKLLKQHCGLRIPARSTIQLILERRGFVKKRKRRRKASPTPPSQLTAASEPNNVWCADYKGQFRLGNRQYCYPLTVSDLFSRFLLGCDSLAHTRGHEAMLSFDALFCEYGLPLVIRTDNGAPFASTGLLGLSKLSVWLMTLGIRHERIEPGKPQQNGVHERMHRTLKQDATRPAGTNLLQQQQKFDAFRRVFNHERPHEGLSGNYPVELYRRSEKIPKPWLPNYPLHDDQKRISCSGHISIRKGHHYYISAALAGRMIGLREVDEKLWLVSFMDLDLGHIDTKQRRFVPTEID